MIQELLGGGVVEGRKMSAPGGLLGPTTTTTTHEPPPCSSVHSTASSTTSPVASSTTSSNSEQQNLRCPRCDSTNTKFCYYNNYNLTQPRHFCKTCRRYWTQGGALRNVPIGGGCRKTKSSAGISLGAGKPCGGSAGNKPKPLASDVVLGKAAAGLQGGAAAMVLDHDLPSSPIRWTTTPHSSHLLSLLRATHNSAIGNPNSSTPGHNPNPNPIRNTHNTLSPVRVKEEGAPMVGSHLVPEASLLINALNARSLGLDPLGQVPLGLCGSLWRSSQYPHQQPQPHPQPHNNGMLLGDQNHGSSGIQELFQRLRSTGNCYNDHPAAALGNVGSTTTTTTSSFSSPISFSTTPTAATTTTTILEPTPAVGGGEFGCWNAPFAWADMPNTNGAFP